MPVQRIGDLDIDQDITFQRKEWRVQRGAWLIVVLVLLLALSGLFGGGPLANASVSDTANVLTVDHHRIDRLHSPSNISLKVVPAGTQPVLRLWISEDYLEGVEITNIHPEPSAMIPDGDRTILEFQLADPGQTVNISLSIEHTEIGAPRAEIGVVDGPRVEFRQVVLP
jgi:hypothetical protein